MVDLALGADAAAEQVNHLLYISQSQAKALDVVPVAGRNAVEFLEDLLQVFTLHADAVIGDCDLDVVLVGVDRGHHEFGWHIFAAVLDGVIQQVENHVGEVHAVYIDDGILGIEVGIDVPAIFLDLEFKRVDDAVDAGVGIFFFKAHGGVLAVKE